MTWKKLQAAAVVAVIIGLLPALTAYESSLVNVTSRVVQPAEGFFNDTSAAPPLVFESGGYRLKYHPAIAFPGRPGNWDYNTVYAGEVACWEFALTIVNTYPYEMGEVMVYDKYGAQRLEDGTFLVDAVDVVKRVPTGGQILKRPENPDSFTSQIEFTWYPGLDDGETGPGEPGFDPADSELAKGETQSMTVTLCTKRNPNVQQEFTSLGQYQMNEGATFSWLNPLGQRFNSVESSLQVKVIAPKPKAKGRGKNRKEKKSKKTTVESTGQGDVEAIAPKPKAKGRDKDKKDKKSNKTAVESEGQGESDSSSVEDAQSTSVIVQDAEESVELAQEEAEDAAELAQEEAEQEAAAQEETEQTESEATQKKEKKKTKGGG